MESSTKCHCALVIEHWIRNFRSGPQSFSLYLYLCLGVFEISVTVLDF